MTRIFLGTRSSSSAFTDSAEQERTGRSAIPEGSSAFADSTDSASSKRTGRSAIPGGDSANTDSINGKGWHYRGYLPHFDCYNVLQSITFRLADSLPQSVLLQLEDELAFLPPEEQSLQRRIKIEKWLDAGYGCCALAHPKMAEVMRNALHFHDGDWYDLLAWCIMPNHVHVLINPSRPLGKIVQSWKSFTGRFARQHWAELELGSTGGGKAEHELRDPRGGLRDSGGNAKSFWMEDYWDRFIRDEQHLVAVIDYLHENPVKAGLCDSSESWAWSSADLGTRSSSSAFVDGADSKRTGRSAIPGEDSGTDPGTRSSSSAFADSADGKRTGRSAIPDKTKSQECPV